MDAAIEAPSVTKPASRWRLVRVVFRALTVFFVAFVAFALTDAWTALGTSADGARLTRMQASEQWDGDGFENPEPLWNDTVGWVTEAPQDHATPTEELPVVRGDGSVYATPPETGLRVTWLGHSTTLIEVDGYRILTDPVWGERTSPVGWAGPRRWYAPPIPLDDLPELDAVLISHDHYDHLDHPTIVALIERDVPFIMPLGVGAHLEYWGVPAERIIELDWWDRTEVGDLQIVCAPARHASGRHLLDQNATLWAGYALIGPEHRVFFSGDTGLFNGMRDIGERLGPFDLTMIEVGAYGQTWPDWHLGPEQAVLAHGWLRGGVLLPIHWGLFDLALHGWTEPIERTLVAAEAAGVQIVSPPPGGSFEPTTLDTSSAPERWWPERPWRTAEQYPIRATRVDREPQVDREPRE